MSKNISFNEKVAKRMNAIKEKLEEEDYNDGEDVTWSVTLEYLLKEAGKWKMPTEEKVKKKKSKTGSKKASKQFRNETDD